MYVVGGPSDDDGCGSDGGAGVLDEVRNIPARSGGVQVKCRMSDN